MLVRMGADNRFRMVMLVMIVMYVLMFVFQLLVYMPVLVLLRQMQPDASSHQQRRDPKLNG